MILLLDAGNSRLKISWVARAGGARAAELLSLDYAELHRLERLIDFAPRQILASNVAGEGVKARLDELGLRLWRRPIRWLDARCGHELLHNPHAEPGRMGADRWLGLLGMVRECQNEAVAPEHAILVSFGTATTVDSVAWRGARAHFLGGLILPGYQLMLQSLARGTAQLPHAAGEYVPYPLNTHDSIASGVQAAQCGAVLRQWQLAATNGAKPLLFVSGGNWPALEEALTRALPEQYARASGAGDQALLRWRAAPVLDGLAWLSGLVY